MASDKTIYDFLRGNTKQEHISFHMPGHKSRGDLFARFGYDDFLNRAIKYDITEIPGADALYRPQSTLRSVMNNYAELYGVRHTELLVNGSSAGIIAAILATVPVGGKLMLGRNSHHSAFSALRLGGINPVYIRPETDSRHNLSAEISPYSLEEACMANPEASAVLITSPNYCGMLSDIALLSDVAHEYGMTLIVDQAHGAHLRFFDYDAKALRNEGAYVPHISHSAEALGADVVINSTHKTLLSFTGSGILNICGRAVDIDAVSDALRMVQTTSPSYLLMTSLDINERIMREHWREIVSDWKSDLEYFYREASRIDGLTLVQGGGARGTGAADEDCFPLYRYREGIDISKINISMAELGLSGERLEHELRYKGIVGELVHGEYLLLMSGAGNTRGDYERLLAALRDIAASYGISTAGAEPPRSFEAPVPEVSDVPASGELVPLYKSEGRIVYEPIITYPPGTPIVCPGEIMSMEVISYIQNLLEEDYRISGVDDEGMIKVGSERVKKLTRLL
ncbi:MAG: aminotransferase class I/II-fold pyridoxal phosphate-dependent enzyme [Mogibacterium sp.]|nr:aminotransferase class I/II-fold pyridoxal phosphate-dependent enzyme [Mogibacterium sp.]